MTTPNRQARKSVRLVSAELGFTIFVQFVSGIALARILEPGDFGLFGITITVFGLAGLFADWGAKQRLIQTRTEPDRTMLKIALTSRLLLCALVLPVLWALSTTIAGVYTTHHEQLSWMIRVQSLVIVLAAVRQNSEISLERNLNYQPLAVVGMLETLLRRGLILGLALAGAGAWSFVWGHLVAFLAATVAIRQVSGAPLGLAFDRRVAVDLIRHALAFRLDSVGSRLRKLAMLTLATRILGLDATGYIKWAQDTGARSLLLVNSTTRVALSHFSRLRDHPSGIQNVLQRYIYLAVILLGLWFAVLTVAGEDLILGIYTDKWLPAWGATCLFALGAVLVAIGHFCVAALQGVGRARLAMVLTLFQAGATLVAVFLLVSQPSSLSWGMGQGLPGVPLGEILAFAVTLPFLVWAIPGVTPAVLLLPLTRLLLPLGLSLTAGTLVARMEGPVLLIGLINAAVTTTVYLLGCWATGPTWLRNFVREEIGLILGVVRSLRRWKPGWQDPEA